MTRLSPPTSEADTSAARPANPLYAYVGAFADELRRCGVVNAVICPGSRSTPLALALAAQPGIHTWMHVDERSAGFFALGLAKRLGAPVALLCTSGTAAANFLPAVVEARLSHVPLLVLTADRPPELRENGAPQAIDQNRLYGSHAKWYAEAALPEATDTALRSIRTLAGRAAATALALPTGPVHLNFPFREPLTPDPQPLPAWDERAADAWEGRPDEAPYVRVQQARLAALPFDGAALDALAARLQATPRGLIVVGPHTHADLAAPLLALAAQLGYPVLADPLSGLRGISPDSDETPTAGARLLVASYDAFLRAPQFVERYAPEIVLRFGAMPTAKPLLLYLKHHTACPQIVIDGTGSWEEPTQLATEMVRADPAAFCEALGGALVARERLEPSAALTAMRSDAPWAAAWQRAERLTRQTLHTVIGGFESSFEGRVFQELAALLPEAATLFVGNSMPVRDCDTFYWGGRAGRVLGNRGANGIDGVVSTALGVSAAAGPEEPVVLVIGDLSLYHDLNGLLAARLHHLNLTVVLVNNDGGGIFSFLPQAEYPDHFEQLFGTPTGLDFALAVQMYGGHFERAATWEQFRAAVSVGLEGAAGLRVIEVATDRTRNVAMHRQLWRAVEDALTAEGVIPPAEARR